MKVLTLYDPATGEHTPLPATVVHGRADTWAVNLLGFRFLISQGGRRIVRQRLPEIATSEVADA